MAEPLAPHTYAERFDAGMKDLHQGRLDQAEAVFVGLCEAAPDRPGAFLGLAHVAQSRGDWVAALACWENCLARFPHHQPVAWRASRAWSLLHLGRHAEAERAFLALSTQEPAEPRTLLGLAESRMREERWAEAVVAWDGLIGRFPERVEPRWRLRRAQCLRRIGRTPLAIEAYEDAIAQDPNQPVAHASLAALYRLASQPADAGLALQRGLAILPDDPSLLVEAARLALSRQDPAGAQDAVRRALAHVTTSSRAEEIFAVIPEAFTGWARTAAWLELDRLVAGLPAARSAAESFGAQGLALRLRLALRDHAGFLAGLERLDPASTGPWPARFRALAARLKSDRFPDFAAPKIFGIGLSRTGTTSLIKALEILGFEGAHYTNPFTHAVLTIEDAFLFDALGDTPVALLFEALYHMFPRARFIYTVRAEADWRRSVEAHFRRLGRSGAPSEWTPRGLTTDLPRAMVRGALYEPHVDPPAARNAFDRRVRDFFAHNDPARLLVFNMFEGDGWDKLCSFLDRPVPVRPFPWENRSHATGGR